MKRFVVLFALCSFLSGCITGCADVAETDISREVEGFSNEYVAATATPVEEGYYVVEGVLNEINKNELFLETEDGNIIYFRLAPETIIYAGKNKELFAGQNIKVVFDGELSEEEIENVSVIAVTLSDEGL